MPWTGIEPARPGLKVRIGSQQPPRRCALRTGLEPVISRSTGGRPLQLDRQSLAEGGGVEPHGRGHDPGSNRAPGHPGVAFHPRRERGSNSHARVGLPFSRRLPSPAIGWSLLAPRCTPGRTRTCMPARDLVYSQAGQPIAQPTHVPQRWHPRRLRRGSLRRQETAPAARVRLLPDAVHYRVRPHSPSLGSESGEVSARPCDR